MTETPEKREEPDDPYDLIEHPSLAEKIKPYREYGDTELALSLLEFQNQNAVAVPSIQGDHSNFAARCQPANVGFNYHCEECQENVRGVTRPGVGVLNCPLCGQQVGMLELGRGPK